MITRSEIAWWALLFGIVALIGCLIIDHRLDKIERHECAWIYFEDGSVIYQANDDARFKCMNDRKDWP